MWRKYIVSSSRHHHNHILCMCIMCCSNGWTGRFPHGIVWGLAVGTFRRLLCLSYAYNEFLQADAGWADVLHGAETADDVDRPGTVLRWCELCRTQVYPAATLVPLQRTDGRTGLQRENHLNLRVNLVNTENERPWTSRIWKLVLPLLVCFVFFSLSLSLTCSIFSFEIAPTFG